MEGKSLNLISEKISGFLSTKDNLLENEYVEILGDAFKTVKFLKSANDLIAKRKFIYFLKGFYGVEKPTEQKLEKLSKYIDNEAKAEFIADSFSKVLLSNSKFACTVMGYTIQNLIDSKTPLSYDTLICSAALCTFFDYDVINYKGICDVIAKYFEKYPKRNIIEYNYKLIKNCNRFSNQNEESIRLTIEKSFSQQLFERQTDIDLDMDEDDVTLSDADTSEYIKVTSPGKSLYKRICAIEGLMS